MEDDGEDHAHNGGDGKKDDKKLPDGIRIGPETHDLKGKHGHEKGKDPDADG